MSVRRVDAGPEGGFDVYRTESSVPGPRVVILGGVHGDETEGALAARRLAAASLDLVRGTVDIVPICHEAAFLADSRVSPVDGGNLARVFPGDPQGSPTAKLAHHIFVEVLEGADFLIDLHTSGQSYDMPFLAGYRGTVSAEGSIGERAAVAFGADFVWRHPQRSRGRTVSVVEHAIYCESPGFGATDIDMVERYATGVLRVLDELGVMMGPPRRMQPQIRVSGGGDLDRDMMSVGHRGVFLSEVVSGQRVTAGQRLGRVVDMAGNLLADLNARSDSFVMALKRRSPVVPGDLVVCLAGPDSA